MASDGKQPKHNIRGSELRSIPLFKLPGASHRARLGRIYEELNGNTITANFGFSASHGFFLWLPKVVQYDAKCCIYLREDAITALGFEADVSTRHRPSVIINRLGADFTLTFTIHADKEGAPPLATIIIESDSEKYCRKAAMKKAKAWVVGLDRLSTE